MIRTELLPVAARLAPDYLTHLTARGIVANGRVLRTMAAADNAHAPDPDTLIAQAAPPASPLYSLAAARLEWSPVGDRTFVDRLGLLTSHRHPAAFGGGFGVRGAIEVVAGGLGVPLTEGDAVAIRLRQGVFDTNAEAFWWPGEHLLNTGEAYQGAQDWMALTAERRSQIGSLRLSPDAQARIALDLDSGLVIVTPTAPTGPEHYVGWWRVDPRTGETHGVVGTGWGMCQEYASLLESALIRAAADFEFEYAMCQGLEQGINAVKAGVADAQARGFLRGLGPVEYQSAKKVFKENDRNCVFVAITAGVFSTLPIILKVGQAMRMQRIAARRTAFLAEREGLRKELEALAKRMGPPRPPGPKPRSLREAEQAFKKAMEYYNDAASKYADFVKSGNGSLNDFRALRAALDDAKGLVNETGNTMTAARREAARMADANRVRKSAPTLPELEKELAEVDKKIADFDRTIPDFNRDFAESLLQIGFGGVLTGK